MTGRPVKEGRCLRVTMSIAHVEKLRVAIFCLSRTSRLPCLLSALMRLKVSHDLVLRSFQPMIVDVAFPMQEAR